MTLTKDDMDYQMYHKHGGNAWAIVEMVGDNYCRLVSLGKNTIGNQAFLAYGGMMERNGKLSDGFIPELSTLRNKIESGKIKVVSTYFKTVA